MGLVGTVDDGGRWICKTARFQAVEAISAFGIRERLYVEPFRSVAPSHLQYRDACQCVVGGDLEVVDFHVKFG